VSAHIMVPEDAAFVNQVVTTIYIPCVEEKMELIDTRTLEERHCINYHD
jgi:hypothetical protein